MSIESEPYKELKEKPEFLFHGSINAGIALLEPRKRYTPSAGAPERVYASGNPAFAAAHSLSPVEAMSFRSVTEAVEYFGGMVRILET